MTFSIGFVSERTQGTLVRLAMSPLRRVHLIAGKSLACFSALVVVESIVLLVGRVFFNVRPSSSALLLLAAVSSSAAFVVIMMLAASLGKTEQAAGGMGWAIMLPRSMLGGGMVPLFMMPTWMSSIGVISPVRWAILAFEGAIWRGFTPREMLLPCGVLLGLGVACFCLGERLLKTG